MNFDTIIVGGGSAGCVLANRLSAKSSRRVLLLEAGQDTPDGRVPEAILDSRSSLAFRDQRFLWNELRVTTAAIPHNAPDAPRPDLKRYEQARVLGGGSSINGQLANRGSPGDYDEWAARGATGWSWDEVLPYFRKVERDIDFDGPLHGNDGRIPVRRVFPENWPPHAKAVGEAFRMAGFPYVADQNGVFEDGYYPLTMSNLYERRVSAAVGYLGPTVRQRANLTVSAETEVRKLLFDGNRCIGVRAAVAGRETDFHGAEVILCCGAIHSPAVLLRNGIGPSPHLRAMNIPVVAHVPGVGQGLTDHPSITVAAFLKSHARDNPFTKRPLVMGARFSSGIPDAPAGDMALSVSTHTAWHAMGHRICGMTIWVNKTFSTAGEVRLASADPRVEPEVDFNLLSDQRDLTRLMDAFRRIAAVYAQPPLREVTEDVFPSSFSDKIRRVGTVNLRNRLLTEIGARLMDGPPALRRFIIQNFIIDGKDTPAAMHDDEMLETYVRRAAIGVWHASCSCRMGAAGDPMAVTDEEGRVRGVDALRVVDASIFPSIPCANINFPVMMVAEKIADRINCG